MEDKTLDVRMVQAGIAVAVAMTLLVPTFNALSKSYVENVPPPPWFPTPEKPPNITPPSNFQPPTGMTPPTGFEGEYEGPVPPACPPPVIKRIPEVDDVDESIRQGNSVNYNRNVAFTVPNATIGVRIYVNYTDWQASAVHAGVDAPEGAQDWEQDEQGAGGGLLFAQSTPRTTLTYDSYTEENGKPAIEGEYTLRLSADFVVNGNVKAEGYMLLACGGLLS